MKKVAGLLFMVVLMVSFSLTIQAKNSKVCVDHNGKSISVSVNAVPAFVLKGSAIGCTLEEQKAFAWFLQSNPSNTAIVDAAANLDAVVASYQQYLAVLEYQQYQDATVDEEGEFEEENFDSN